MHPPNPVNQIQQELGLSDTAFATLLDVSHVTLRSAKRGLSQEPRGVLQGLFRLGYDTEYIGHEYTAFRDALRADLIASVG